MKNKSMKKLSFWQCLLFSLCLYGITSCEKVVLDADELSAPDEEAPAEADGPVSQLRVRSRGAQGDEGEVSFPLRVYVFNGAKCKAVQTLETADDVLELKLPAATYDVYAVGGASEQDYVLPTIDDATLNSVVSLRQGSQHGDLMTAQNTVVLKADEQTELTLAMERKVVQLRSVTLKKIPAEVTAVSVSFAPLCQELSIAGVYSGRGALADLPLQPADVAGTWTTAQPVFVLPSVGNATVTIALTTLAGTKNYSYTCTEPLEANYIFDVTGTYVGTDGLLLGGTYTGATWQGEREIVFSFSGATDNTTGNDDDPAVDPTPADDEPLTAIPSVGDLYRGCCVLAVNNATDTSADLVLLSPTEKAGVADHADDPSADDTSVSKAKVDAELAAWAAAGVTSGWRMMTIDEMNKSLIPNYATLNATLAEAGQTVFQADYYLVWNPFTEMILTINCKTKSVYASFSPSSKLRPVADVHVTIE